MGVILLDIGNVLVNVDFMSFCNTVSRDGHAGAEAIAERFCQGELKDRLDTGRMAPRDFLDLIAADPHTRDIPFDRLRLAWQDIFSPLSGSQDAVRQLKQRHEIWIMSDTEPLHFAFLIDRFPVLRSHDRYFLSFEHGYLKRSPDAFHYIIDQSGRDVSEFLLIDDRQVNTRACSQAGIAAMLFENWPQTLASPELVSGSSFFRKEIIR